MEYDIISWNIINEIRALIGLFYLRGVLDQNLHSVKDLFYLNSSCDVFAATMNYMRFYFLSQMVQFDDKETRAERWRMDLFTALRKIFESFNVNCTTFRIPSEYLAIDETLHTYRGMVKLKQYNPTNLRNMDFYIEVFLTVLFHTLILHYRMEGNLKLKILSFMLLLLMSMVRI